MSRKILKPEDVKVVEVTEQEPIIEETEPIMETEPEPIMETEPPIVETEPEPEQIPSGPTLNDVPIGQNFRFNNGVYKKVNTCRVQNFLKGDDATEAMAGNTVIEPILPGHAVEPDA